MNEVKNIATRITDDLISNLVRLKAPDAKAMPRKILVVDDDSGFRELLKKKLSDRGCQVETASEGDLAIRMVEEARPFSFVFLDLAFPTGKQGVEILMHIRRIAPLVPVTLISGYISPELCRVAEQIHCTVIDKLAPKEEFERGIDSIIGPVLRPVVN